MKFLVLDTETCNTPLEDGQVATHSGQVYDLGGQVIDEKGNVYEQFSWVIEDVFFGMPQAMQEAYYADKIPQYLEDMRMHRREILNIWEAYFQFRAICKRHGIKCVVAHNSRFDMTTLNASLRYLTKSRKRYFLPYGVKVVDSLKVAKKVLGDSNDYIAFCKENDYMTSHATPRPRYTAEVLYRYFTGDTTFSEEHTGLADVKIESMIFTRCLEALRGKASEAVSAA